MRAVIEESMCFSHARCGDCGSECRASSAIQATFHASFGCAHTYIAASRFVRWCKVQNACEISELFALDCFGVFECEQRAIVRGFGVSRLHDTESFSRTG